MIPATLPYRVALIMRIGKYEIFGPMKGVVSVSDQDEAVAYASDSEFSIRSVAPSCKVVRAMNLAMRIDSGIGYVESQSVQDEAQMLFGGEKGSVFGWRGGQAGIAG